MNKKILAFSIADGHLTSSGRLILVHCKAQEEYFLWKVKQIEPNFYKEFNNNGFPAWKLHKSFKDEGKKVHKKLYGVMRHKYYSDTIVDNLDKFCIAILYCDDGSLVPKKRNNKIHSYQLSISMYTSYQECERLRKKIKELFDCDFNIVKDKNKYILRCGTRIARKFLPQILAELPHFKCFENTKLKEI